MLDTLLRIVYSILTLSTKPTIILTIHWDTMVKRLNEVLQPDLLIHALIFKYFLMHFDYSIKLLSLSWSLWSRFDSCILASTWGQLLRWRVLVAMSSEMFLPMHEDNEHACLHTSQASQVNHNKAPVIKWLATVKKIDVHVHNANESLSEYCLNI